MSKQDRILIFPLLLIMTLASSFLVSRLLHHLKPHHLARTIQQDSRPVVASASPPTLAKYIKPTQQIATAKLPTPLPSPQNYAPSQRQMASLPSSPQIKNDNPSETVSPNETPEYSPEIARVLEDIDYNSRRSNEFLKKYVGLDDSQIQTMERKRAEYLQQLNQLKKMETMGQPVDKSFKDSVISKHIQWMTNFMGANNYYEYLDFTTE